MSVKAHTEGLAEHDVEGVSVPIYTPARTVADCFRFRSTIGRDVAIEALRDDVENDSSVDELWSRGSVRVEGTYAFLVWQGDLHRPTKDLDLLGYGDPAQLEEIFRTACQQLSRAQYRRPNGQGILSRARPAM